MRISFRPASTSTRYASAKGISYSLFAAHDQQRRFSGAEDYIFNAADLAITVPNFAADQIAYVIPTWFELSAIARRHLQLGANQRLCVVDCFNPLKLQDDQTLVRPRVFDFQFATIAAFRSEPTGEDLFEIDLEPPCEPQRRLRRSAPVSSPPEQELQTRRPWRVVTRQSPVRSACAA